MSRALFTAVSGLRNHQVWLDVIGNNIANANTTGFKASSVDRLYTRAGAFSIDANGNLVDGGTGFRVLGASGPIQISLGQVSAATPTTEAQLRGNLDYSVPDGNTFVSTFDIRDSVGAPHTLTVTFTKNFAATPGQWDWAVTAADPSITGLTTGTGSIVFNATGGIASGSSQAIGITYGAGTGVNSPQAVLLDFGTAANPSPVSGLASPSTLTLGNQNGMPAGTLQSFAIGQDGAITGFYSNGISQHIDTVQLATFANAPGLLRVGSNLYRESATSGTPGVGGPGTASRGTLVAGSLEMSNVDLAQEFTSMIIAERGFQANARTISTANQLLEELVNLKR
jgi:flagellar hook protein FlgE